MFLLNSIQRGLGFIPPEGNIASEKDIEPALNFMKENDLFTRHSKSFY